MLVAHAYNPSYLGRMRLGGSLFETNLGKYFPRPHLQNNQSKMDGRFVSSARASALQVQSPEFKTPIPQKKKCSSPIVGTRTQVGEVSFFWCVFHCYWATCILAACVVQLCHISPVLVAAIIMLSASHSGCHYTEL
jgi:hypothetical protein